MDASFFWSTLKGRGYTFFAGVPDSTFQSAYEGMFNDPDIQYIPAVREGSMKIETIVCPHCSQTTQVNVKNDHTVVSVSPTREIKKGGYTGDQGTVRCKCRKWFSYETSFNLMRE